MTSLPPADVTVIVTGHAAIDWGSVMARADLVVDTVNRSAGLPVRPRQVLRLGAGWSGEAARSGETARSGEAARSGES